MTAAPNADVSLQRRRKWLRVVMLLILIGGIGAGLGYLRWSATGQALEGRIVALDNVTMRVTGVQPVITVELEDGSTKRITPAKWAVVGCEVGSSISLIQKGSDVRVGVRGCRLE